MSEEAGPELVLPGVSQEDYDSAGSKFIMFPAGAKPGDIQVREVEVGMVDWDSPGVSMKIPITVTEDGPDKGKEDKVSFGIDPKKALWKGKQLHEQITGLPMPQTAEGGIAIRPLMLSGKAARGVWILTAGHKGGDPGAEPVTYPKLDDIINMNAPIPGAEGLGIG